MFLSERDVAEATEVGVQALADAWMTAGETTGNIHRREYFEHFGADLRLNKLREGFEVWCECIWRGGGGRRMVWRWPQTGVGGTVNYHSLAPCMHTRMLIMCPLTHASNFRAHGTPLLSRTSMPVPRRSWRSTFISARWTGAMR